MTSSRPELQTGFCQEVVRLNPRLHTDDIFDLLDLIQAPPTLQAFLVHIPHLPDIFMAAAAVADISGLASTRYRTAAVTAGALHALLPDLMTNRKVRDFRPAVPTPRFGPCTGILEMFPLYSFLAESVRHKDYRQQFIQLQAQVLLAIRSIGKLAVGEMESLLTPFRCLRDLNSHSNWQWLGPLPSSAEPILTYVIRIKTRFYTTKFHPIEHVFRIAEQVARRKTQIMAAAPAKKDAELSNGPHADRKSAEAYLESPRPSTALSPTEAAQYLEHGGLPEELGAAVGFEPVLTTDKYHGPTLRQLAFQAKQASNRRALDNQFSAMAWNQSSLFDLKIFLEFLEGDHVPAIDYTPLTLQEAAALLGLIFFTANSYERLLSLPVYRTALPHGRSPEGIYLPEQKKLVRLFSPGPTLAGKSLPAGAIPVECTVISPCLISLPGCWPRYSATRLRDRSCSVTSTHKTRRA